MSKIARIFRMSPGKNEILRSYAKSENRKSINLLLDCKTIWNSLVTMHERFLDLRSPVEKTLIDYKIYNPLTEAEYVSLAVIVRALKPIQLGSEKHCSRDVALLRNIVVEMWHFLETL